MTLAADLERALGAAKSAGELLLDYWAKRDQLDVSSKRAGDFVSQADIKAEQLLREQLVLDPEAESWLGEESGAAGSNSRRWIVDPLDGTTNFLRGISQWSVSIALEQSGELVLGVVHDPVKQETFSAISGGGAKLNGKPIQVSGTERLTECLFGTGVPFGAMPEIDRHTHEIASLMPHCAGIRRLGSAALDLAYVAAGRLDGFWERTLQPWDFSAGVVLLKESGAVVAGIDPHEDPLKTGSILSANPIIFDDFARVIRAK